MTDHEPKQRLSRLRSFVRRGNRRARLGGLARYIDASERIPGWKRHGEAEALALAARSMRDDAVIVEIGVFLGSATVFLAGARKLAGSGVVHCVDPFDGSGDEYSVPVYDEILSTIESSQFDVFTRTIDSLELDEHVHVHRGTAESIGRIWETPIDLLFLDGDQSPRGARSAYEIWVPWLRSGGTLAIGNSAPRVYQPEHDGNFLLATELVVEPAYGDIHLIGTTTFAVKL